jgi:hypothetical protein
VIVRRKEEEFKTLRICCGLNQWSFSSSFSYFLIPDEDTYTVLSRGNFELVYKKEFLQLDRTVIGIPDRFGPPILSAG